MFLDRNNRRSPVPSLKTVAVTPALAPLILLATSVTVSSASMVTVTGDGRTVGMTTVAADGPTALGMARDEDFDLLVLDLVVDAREGHRELVVGVADVREVRVDAGHDVAQRRLMGQH